MAPKRTPKPKSRGPVQVVMPWVAELLHPSGRWEVTQWPPIEINKFILDLAESTNDLLSGKKRRRYAVFFSQTEALVRVFAEVAPRILPEPTFPWDQNRYFFVHGLTKEIHRRFKEAHGIPPAAEDDSFTGMPMGLAGNSRKIFDEVASKCVELNPPAAPQVEAKPTSETEKEPPRTKAWLKKEAAHQKQVAARLAEIDENIRRTTGTLRQYFQELRKAFEGRPHDDPLWQFIFCNHDSMDDTIPVSEALDFIRAINQKKPMRIISGRPL